MKQNISKKMTAMLAPNIMWLLRRIGKVAASRGYKAYIVGGLVRDIIRGVKNLDLDIVVEGDAIKLGEELAKELKVKLVVHRMFGTCTIALKNKLKIDFATARKERYEHPATLPVVQYSSLEDDLSRRDFTVNAMAASISEDDFGQLTDMFAGLQDLSDGIIRIMHDKSFIDDPTRIFRAVRFESRPGFSIEAKTLQLAKEAIRDGLLTKLSKYRIKNEFSLILKEPGCKKALSRLDEIGAGIIQPFKI
ncbi:MAG: hypothetical protein WCY36_04855 [Candidatus Omnitrophota bacterium]